MCKNCVDATERKMAIASVVAELINSGGQINGKVTPAEILDAKWLLVAAEIKDKLGFYLIRDLAHATTSLEDIYIAGTVRVRHPQWYQGEVCHLAVAEPFRGRGIGLQLIRKAEEYCKIADLMIMQATLRETNKHAKRVFREAGWGRTTVFVNPQTKNTIGVWQSAVPRG